MNAFEEITYKFKQNNAISKIIILNAGIFIFFSLLKTLFSLFNQSEVAYEIIRHLALPASLGKLLYQPWALLSYMFLHNSPNALEWNLTGEIFHVLFNMLWLYWIGSILQEYLGSNKTYQAYILGGLFGGILYVFAYNVFPVFSANVYSSYALGASAGVLSVVVAAATLLPEYSFMLLFLGAVRLKYIALVSVMLDLISIPSSNPGGHIAHLGGAAFGFLFIKYLYNKNSNPNWLDRAFDKVIELFKPKPKIRIHYKTTYVKPEEEIKPSQDQVDAILDKISRSGYESLSKKEKEVLFKASKD